MKKRCVEQVHKDHDQVPTKQLIGGDKNVSQSPHPTKDNHTMAHSKLCTCFRGKDVVDDVCWFAHHDEKGGRFGEDINNAMNWIAGHMLEENAAMCWIKQDDCCSPWLRMQINHSSSHGLLHVSNRK